MAVDIGAVGVWAAPQRWQGIDLTEAVAELDRLGYGAFWLGGSPSGDLGLAEALLAGSARIPVATGIVNLWDTGTAELAHAFHRVDGNHPGRFVLGIGAGHREAAGAGPYQRLTEFLDGFDERGVPAGQRVLAALGPRMLALSAGRAAGAHPYLVPPEHTRRAREILGPGALLAPEQKVLLETDPDRARAVARCAVRPYLALPDYTRNLRRLGYADGDLAGAGSDRLVDDLVAWGDERAVRDRVAEHLRAGADHVAIQVLNAGADRLAALGRLAPALLDLRR
ncbi:MAG TPA: LLM class F420-dependent oxidoreductase [Actinophytocola sp.]|uniref:LLM class F420-dependent oxidoreductase n=1 Tax=Actinophytocola sp. TaxID=1872138 RepID=UPI002DBBF6A7|nr:LLM class F420-dependent oxidoreductase [Actinophytocola sp.]HEU5472992.1 LLM class F420-dependent oxidoreductase [Actinophytocola sp.]